MNEFGRAFRLALDLLAHLDPELGGIVGLSLRVSLSATVLAFVLGLPIGAALAVGRFPGRRAAIVAVHALLGLPPVVVGLVVYLLLSRSARTAIPVCFVNGGSRCANRPDCSVEVVDTTVIERSAAVAGMADARAAKTTARSVRRTSTALLIGRVSARPRPRWRVATTGP